MGRKSPIRFGRNYLGLGIEVQSEKSVAGPHVRCEDQIRTLLINAGDSTAKWTSK